MRVEAGGYINRAVEKFADRIAIATDQGAQTYRALNEDGNRIGSGLLAFGLSRGDRIGVLSYNRIEVAQLWLGLEKHNLNRAVMHSHFDMAIHVATLNHIGAAALVFDTRFTAAVEAHKSNFTTVHLFVAIGPNPPAWAMPYGEILAAGTPADPLLDVDDASPCFLQLTTGTTGVPKPWIATFRSWRAVILANTEHFDTFGPGIPAIGPDDVNLHFHPLQWATGFQTLFPYFLRGARTVLVDDETFEPKRIVDAIVREGVTGLFVPGPMLNPILDDFAARRGVTSTMRRLMVFIATPEQLNRATEVFGPVWSHGFGSTEQGAPTTRLTQHEAQEKPERITSVGRVISPFHEIAIMDESGHRLPPREIGEIVVRSPMSTSSYWDLPEQTANAFFPGDWFRPRDIGFMDEDGFLYYLDRAKDRILTEAGVVYPHAVESAVQIHDAVANCGVVGLGGGAGQTIVVAVLLKPGWAGSDDLVAEILAIAKGQLKPHELPGRVVFVEELPTVLGGAKVQREVLQERLIRIELK